MTPENDKTLRGIFAPRNYENPGFNDAQIYRNTYRGGKYFVKDSVRRLIMNVNLPPRKPKSYVDDDRYMEWFSRMFPESKIGDAWFKAATYGMAENVCDCCGKDLHLFNSPKGRHLCHGCDTEMDRGDVLRGYPNGINVL